MLQIGDHIVRSLRETFLTIGVLAALCLLPSLTYGDPVTVTFNSPNGANLGGVYTDPYNGSISGLGNVHMICDDYGDHIVQPESWYANSLNFSQIAGSSQPLFTNNVNAVAEYAAVGWLAEQIFNNPANAISNEYLSWAIWDILTPGALGDLNTGNTAADRATVLGWETTAAQNADVTLASYSDLTLYTPTGEIVPGSSSDGRPQEMIVRTPEAPGLALLGLDISGLVGLLAVLRRRIRRRH